MGANHIANPTQSTDSANPISERSDTITCHKMIKLQSASNQMLVKDKQSGLEKHRKGEGTKRYGAL